MNLLEEFISVDFYEKIGITTLENMLNTKSTKSIND
jgi:hypothetical protein